MILQAVSLRNVPENPVFPFTLDLIKNFESLSLKAPITFFVGENGAGKSTLLEAIAYAARVPTAGSASIDDDELMQPARSLGAKLSLRFNEKNVGGFFTRAEDFIGFVKKILKSIAEIDAEMADIKANWQGGDLDLALGPFVADRKAFVDRYTENLDGMSHGEGFLKFFLSRITGKGLYLIDEPEAALSPQRQLSLMSLISQKVKENGSQFIIATHSPIIMAMPEAQILHFENNTIKEINYTETTHYQLTKQFLDNPKVFLREL
jgi:predicted ATPase